MAEKDIHFYEPVNGHGLKHVPVQRHCSAQADRLDLFARFERKFQPRTVQLF